MAKLQANWGKLIRGAAIAGGAVAVVAFFPGLTGAVGEGIKTGMDGIYSAFGTLGEWIGERIARLAALAAENKALAIGSAAAAGALMAARQPDHTDNVHYRVGSRPYRDVHEEGYAMREDAREMQARMVTALRSHGLEPATGLSM